MQQSRFRNLGSGFSNEGCRNIMTKCPLDPYRATKSRCVCTTFMQMELWLHFFRFWEDLNDWMKVLEGSDSICPPSFVVSTWALFSGWLWWVVGTFSCCSDRQSLSIFRSCPGHLLLGVGGSKVSGGSSRKSQGATMSGVLLLLRWQSSRLHVKHSTGTNR